jgi:hypothetical protein
MVDKFDENFLDLEQGKQTGNKKFNQREILIDLNNINESDYDNICKVEFNKFNKCKNMNMAEMYSKFCSKTDTMLLQCLHRHGKSVFK